MAGPRSIVTVSLVGTAGVVIIANAAKGQAPKPRTVLGLGVVFVALSAVGDFAPKLAGPFAALVFTGTLLTEGAGALDAVAGALGGAGRLGLADQGGHNPLAGPAGASQGGGATMTGADLLAGPKALSAVRWAKSVLGLPYVWGGESRAEGGFDCSGLCQFAYGRAGVQLPRTAAQQQQVGTDVAWGAFLPGDLIFQGDPAHHEVMYVGAGKAISAPHRGARVHITPVTDFRSGFTNARRVVPPKTAPGGRPPKR